MAEIGELSVGVGFASTYVVRVEMETTIGDKSIRRVVEVPPPAQEEMVAPLVGSLLNLLQGSEDS